MDYLITFLEGIITFISPCLLPMLPVYISYFAGQNKAREEAKKRKTLINAIGFVVGFTFMFVILGAFAGSIGSFFSKYQNAVNIISGLIMILFGLNFMQIINIPILNLTKKLNIHFSGTGFFSSVLFGIVFSIGWTPCVGAFLGTALLLAAQRGAIKGILMLFCFSSGLGIPFIISALLIEKLKNTFTFIKNHYRIINIISGGLLVVIGILTAVGKMGYFLSLLTL